jgi:hypothetical protein
MKVESERIRDVKRRDICEIVGNNREKLLCFSRRIWIELLNNVTQASFWSRIMIISECFAFVFIQDV